MQLMAIAKNATLISALNAHKKVPYRCQECAGIVFLRGGKETQPHFFHKERHACRHDAKGPDHLHIQVRIQKEINGSLLEERFLDINRIADICSHNLKLIIEIQCSSMSLLELKTRTLDYESLGYQIIWILHTKVFFQKKIKPLEKFLEKRWHYFTDINEKGEGSIFDQISSMQDGKREIIGQAQPVSFSTWPLKDLSMIRKAQRKKQAPQLRVYLQGYLKTAFSMLLENSCHGK